MTTRAAAQDEGKPGSENPPNREPEMIVEEPPFPPLRPFIGRSRGVIVISDEDLMAPVGANWEVDQDL